jgi:hypothetical protein
LHLKFYLAKLLTREKINILTIFVNTCYLKNAISLLGDRKRYEQQLFDLLFEMKKSIPYFENDIDDASSDVANDVPFVERLRRRRIERRGLSFQQQNIDWSQFNCYLENRTQEMPSNHPPLLVTSDFDDTD